MKRFMFGLAAMSLLAGCGIPGGLERPGPMWDSRDALRYECTRELARNEVRDPRCEEWLRTHSGAESTTQSAEQHRSTPNALLRAQRGPNDPYIDDSATTFRQVGPRDNVISIDPDATPRPQ